MNEKYIFDMEGIRNRVVAFIIKKDFYTSIHLPKKLAKDDKFNFEDFNDFHSEFKKGNANFLLTPGYYEQFLFNMIASPIEKIIRKTFDIVPILIIIGLIITTEITLNYFFLLGLPVIWFGFFSSSPYFLFRFILLLISILIGVIAFVNFKITLGVIISIYIVSHLCGFYKRKTYINTVRKKAFYIEELFSLLLYTNVIRITTTKYNKINSITNHTNL